MIGNKCESESNCQSCGDSENCSQTEKEAHEETIIAKRMGEIKHKFMVISGKGGVGKTSVTVNLAATLVGQGYKVGILDADIHGPNIPKMLGVDDRKPLAGEGNSILPIAVTDNLRVMSIAFFLNNTEDAVVWRGPMKHNMLKQFLGEVSWGELDYLIIDLPPGTGDEALSIAHLMKDVDAAVVVTTPQEVALLDSRKSISFCREIKIPIIGVVENMSGLICPHCKEEIDLFKTGGGEKIAAEMKIPFLGRIPLDPEMVICADEGSAFVNNHPDSIAAKAFFKIADEWKNRLGR
jgi:ATP-binding protein involved in chromosome partitioning